MADRLIVVNGMAGAGKTTLAAPLAAEIGAIVVSKDAIKEALGDAIAYPLPTKEIGAVAMDALWRIVGMLEGTVLIESVWLANRDEEWFQRGWEGAGAPTGVEVWCEAPRQEMRQRFLTRQRHVVHHDHTRLADWETAAGLASPITGFPVVRVDTSRPADLDQLAGDIRAALGANRSKH